MIKIQTFIFKSSSIIISTQDKLKDYCYKLAAVKLSARNAYNNKALLLVLIRALLREYKVTINTLNAQYLLTINKRLQTLKAKHANLQEEEHAYSVFRAKKYASKYVLPHCCSCQSSKSSSSNTICNYTSPLQQEALPLQLPIPQICLKGCLRINLRQVNLLIIF